MSVFDEAFKKMGIAFVSEVCLFHYIDAPVSFVMDAKYEPGWVEVEEHVWMPGLVQVVEYATAKWKGELMFYDGAQLAFATESSVLCADYCCN